MLQLMTGLPAHVIGIKATGEVTKVDYDTVLLPHMDDYIKRQGEINYLLVLETEVGKFKAGAWWNDFKLGIKNFTKWNKIAIVTGQKSVSKFTDIFSFTIPGESKGFDLSQIDEAKKWVSQQ